MIWVLGFFLINFGLFLIAPESSRIYKYSKNVCLTYDQAINVIFINGDPDETISSRAHKGKLRGSKGWSLMAKLLDLIDPGHTERAVEWDEGTETTKVPLSNDTNKTK